jgi:hypothetical protein
LAERSHNPILRLGFAIGMIALSLAATEAAMRYLERPPGVISGWRATGPAAPVNQFGFRGQPPTRRQASDFVVVLTGGGAVECVACAPDETLDLILERALRRYNPNARVISLGSRGHGQDQQYLALHDYLAHQRADLILNWASIAEDVPANTFRSGQPRPGVTMPKPTFALRVDSKGEGAGDDIVGPTEEPGQQVYGSKLSTLLRPMFIDLDRNWTTLLPPPDAGASSPAPGAESQAHVDEALEEQRSSWSIWLTPRPARVKYGIILTRALERHMRELAALRGARFAIVLTPPAPAGDAPIALEHGGRWFLADPAARDAAIAEITNGFETISLPAATPQAGDGAPAAADTERRAMARLAEALSQRNLLTPAVAERPRH